MSYFVSKSSKNISDYTLNKTKEIKNKLNTEKHLLHFSDFSIEKLRNVPLNKLLNRRQCNIFPKVIKHKNNKTEGKANDDDIFKIFRTFFRIKSLSHQ